MAASLCSSAVLMGCGSDKPRADDEKSVAIEKGNLKLALTGVGASGAVYRLRNAEFRISAYNGEYETTVSTEDDPEGTFIYLEVPAGDYSVYLMPGYTVEQVNGGGASGPTPGTTSTPMTPPPAASTVEPEVTEPEANARGFARAGEWPSQTGAAVAARAAGDGPDGGAPDEESSAPVVVDGGAPETDDGSQGGIEFELISENPAYVYVYAYGLSMVNFSFLVNGGVVNTGSGALLIGASFYEDDPYGYTCPGDDPYEPNDFYSPAYIPTDETIYAFSCVYEDDMYLFNAPTPAGELFKIEVSFDPNVADIDIEYGTSYYEYLGGSFGFDGTETVVGVSNGGDYLLHVFNYGPQSAPYQINFSSVTSDNSCCEASDSPGCNEPSVLSCLCAIDSVCCTGSFDEVCVQEAIAECGAQCEQPEPTSTCCEAAPEPGCLDETVEACVCGIDPTCCTSTFDQNCANLAQGQCGASCGGGE